MKTAAVFLLTQTCYILFSWYFIDSGGLNWFCMVVLLLILCPILFTDGWKRIIAAICGIYLLVFLTTFLVVLMFLPFGITPHELTGGKLEMVGNFMFSFLYFAGAYIFIAFKNRRARIWSSRETMSAVLFSVIQLFLVQAVAYLMILALPALEDVTLPNAALIAGTVLCMVADILLFRMLMERSQKEQLAMQLSLMEKQSRLELTYYTSVNQKLQEVRKIRHDFNNQLQTAYGVLAQGNSEEAKTLLRQLEERIAASSPVYYCANPIVNAILWEKGQEGYVADYREAVSPMFLRLRCGDPGACLERLESALGPCARIAVEGAPAGELGLVTPPVSEADLEALLAAQPDVAAESRLRVADF